MKIKNKKLKIAVSVIAGVILLFSALMVLNEEIGKPLPIPTWNDVFKALGLKDSAVLDESTKVYFVDVGQGDCEVIISNGQVAVIDAGDVDYGDAVVAFLHSKGVKEIDLLVMTHAHSDHMGGMRKVVESFPVKKMITSELPDAQVPTTKVYQNLLKAVLAKGGTLSYPKVGDTFVIGDGTLTVLSPSKNYDNLNDTSLILRYDVRNTSFLFTGDAEKPAERDLVESGFNVKVDVLKVGHHGSSTSSLDEFIKAAAPTYSIISVGHDNSYNHPNKAVLARLEKVSTVYRTDIGGTVTAETDGQTITITTEK